MELDKVTLPVVLRNLHEYDNQLSDTCPGFDHRSRRIARSVSSVTCVDESPDTEDRS